MLGNFSYSNPTKLYFGEESLCSLNEELPKYGKTVQLIYGGGSIIPHHRPVRYFLYLR